MESLSKLSARALEYYISSRRWKSDLYFSNLEIAFLNRLLNEHFPEMVDDDLQDKFELFGQRLSVLVNEQQQIRELLDLQLGNLERLASDLLNEHTQELDGKQAQLEYLMIDWVHEYRAIKEEIFQAVDTYLDSKRP